MCVVSVPPRSYALGYEGYAPREGVAGGDVFYKNRPAGRRARRRARAPAAGIFESTFSTKREKKTEKELRCKTCACVCHAARAHELSGARLVLDTHATQTERHTSDERPRRERRIVTTHAPHMRIPPRRRRTQSRAAVLGSWPQSAPPPARTPSLLTAAAKQRPPPDAASSCSALPGRRIRPPQSRLCACLDRRARASASPPPSRPPLPLP